MTTPPALAFLAAALAAPAPAAGPALPLSLSLAQAESAALARSPAVKQAQAAVEAARHGAWAAFAGLLPRVSLEGSYRYVAEIPSLALVPKAPPFAFGTHDNYSVGPQAAWTLDAGGMWEQWRAQEASLHAARENLAAARAGVRLQARSTYLAVMLGADQVALLADSLAHADSQAGDIELQRGAGAASTADALAARNEALTRRVQYRQAQADLAGSLRDLFALTGLGADADPSLPVGAGSATVADAPAPTLRVTLDSVTAVEAALAPALSASLAADPARVRALADAAEAAAKLATALSAGHWPRIQVAAKRSVDYPNGPLPDQVWQNTVSVAATFPLFAFGQVSGQASAQEAQAEAAGWQAAQARQDADRDWRKALDQIAALRAERELNARIVAHANELAALMLVSYREGAASYLELETANLGALTAGVQAARTDVSLLLELAMAASLTE